MPERWKPIPSWPQYQASSHGRIRSIDRWVIYSNGSRRFWPSTILKYSYHKKGYKCVRLSKNGKAKTFLVHYLVCTAFHSPRPPNRECRHLDGDNENNWADNLLWGTHQENVEDSIKHDTITKGERNGQAILTEPDVIAIRRSRKSQRILAEEFGVARATISDAQRKHHWKHVP